MSKVPPVPKFVSADQLDPSGESSASKLVPVKVSLAYKALPL
jgi:hypothetical protein